MTDDDGRFRFNGLCEKGVARITFAHDAYIHELIVISTEPELSGYRQAWRMKAAPPSFTHVLETARPIEGIVSDKDTGRPIAGVRVEIGATAAEPGLPFHFPVTTDERGRYRITGIAWNHPRGLHAQLLQTPHWVISPNNTSMKGGRPVPAHSVGTSLSTRERSSGERSLTPTRSNRSWAAASVRCDDELDGAHRRSRGVFALCRSR